MSIEMLTNIKSILACYLFYYFSYLIKQNSRFTYCYGIIQCLLSNFYYFLLYRLLWLTIKNCKVVISMISIEICSYINVYLISQIQRSSWRNSMYYAFIDWHTYWFWKTHKPDRSGIGSLWYKIIKYKPIYVLLSQGQILLALFNNEIFCIFKSFARNFSCHSEFFI